MNKKFYAAAAAAAALIAAAAPVAAITDGELDGEGHPHVVLILGEVDGAPAYRCSGTLISPTLVLTAGHCVNNHPAEGDVTGMRVFLESDVQNGDNSYPFAGNNSVEAVRWEAHPAYEDAPFFVNDVGMIELAEPVDLDTYGTLPQVDSLDKLAKQRGKQSTWFTAVGYGLQQSFPDAASFLENNSRTRYVAHPQLVQINTPGFTGSFSMLLSNNANTGGTCFGDSGGPNFLGDSNIVAGVTSFGINGNCAGSGGVFRIDRQNVQDFIDDFIDG